jgi:hypothetical protein
MGYGGQNIAREKNVSSRPDRHEEDFLALTPPL